MACRNLGAHACAISVFIVGACVTACLPNDSRPTPGSVLVNATSDGVTKTGIASTVDGWAISFERVLVAIGNVELDGDHCVVYSDSGYNRILDMSVEGPQKVSLVYALGHCGFGFRVASPNVNTLLGEGAAETEKDAMRTGASDDYVDDRGIGIYVRGHASKGEVTKSFEWSFRLRASYRRCVASSDIDVGEGVVLESGKAQSIDIGVSPGRLFGAERNVLQPAPRFQTFADADTLTGNDDGAVTLDELAGIPFADSGFTDVRPTSETDEFVDIDATYVHHLRRVDGGWAAPVSLEDYVYLVLFPRMLRFAGTGSCSIQLSAQRGNGRQ